MSLLSNFRIVLLAGFIAAVAFADEPQNAPPVTGKTPADQASSVQVTQPKPTQPDWADPRSLTIGAFYWMTNNSIAINPSVFNGATATSNTALPNFGNYHNGPLVEASYPVTRTGTLFLDAFEIKGTGNQVDAVTTFPLGSAQSLNPGNNLATQYQAKDFHLYLDDLLFPHKFPVSRFRLKSLWGFEYYTIHLTASSILASPIIADDARAIIAPTFGAAAEYALTPHFVARVSAAGFGLPHRSDIAHAEATLSYRKGHLEIVAGEKLLHFKSSPKNSAGYVAGTMIGAFGGLRWHF